MKYVIIGNGVAGVHAAEAIRQLDAKGDITMIGDETAIPYCRPMISNLLDGSVQPDKLPIRSEKFYEDLKITPVLGKRVTKIDVENKSIFLGEGEKKRARQSASLLNRLKTAIRISSKEEKEEKGGSQAFLYDKLLIATGADPRAIKADGMNLKNIFFMRTEHHVRQMLQILPDVRHALVLGGGLVGFKAAYSLLKQGIDVTMLIRSEYPLSMQIDEKAGGMILDELVRQGLKVKVGVEVTNFEGKEKVEKAYLSDGTDQQCEMVVIGKGVLPALSFVPKDKIQVDLGIMVNPYMETSTSGIFAAGDVAETVDIARKNPWVNAIWHEAVAQGRIAGMNMAGRQVAYQGSLSRNVIRVFGLDVMTGGVVNPPDDDSYEVIASENPRLKTYRKLVFKKDKLVGMILVNNIEQGGVLLSLIQSETPIMISRKTMLEPSFNFKKLLAYH